MNFQQLVSEGPIMMLSTRVVQVRPESVNTCSQNSDHLGHRFAAWIAGYDDKPRLSYRRGIQWALAAYRQALGGFEKPSLGPERTAAQSLVLTPVSAGLKGCFFALTR